MTFNATLGGDNSPTDKMNVKGDTQGNTRVRVDNIGGVGAQTVNGIELIEVGGNSAGNFALTTGTVEAGAYVYTLAKGKGNDEKNWYSRRADKTCFQIDLSSLKDKTDNILLCG